MTQSLQKINNYGLLLFYPLNKEDMDIALEDGDKASYAGEKEFVDENIEELNHLLLYGAKASFEEEMGCIAIYYNRQEAKRSKEREAEKKQNYERRVTVCAGVSRSIQKLKNIMKQKTDEKDK